MSEINLINGDCMKYMRNMKDKEYDLAICDPPYGIGGDAIHADRFYKGSGKLRDRALQKFASKWDIAPDKKYFEELKRISTNQIIWGGNYFDLGRCRCFIFWDKMQPWDNFSKGEMAWTSFDTPANLFRFDNRTSDKIHCTQKPVKLYEWLLKNYAKPGDKILDTHGGSMSIAIACYNLDFDLTLFEIDEDYYRAGVERFENHKKQQRLFDINQTQQEVG